MPLYSYRCQNCGNEFEQRQRITDEPLRQCPVCGAEEVRRLINKVGIVFKGGGFYVTDNRNGHKNKSDKAEKATETSKKSETGAATEKGAVESPAQEAKTEAKTTTAESPQ